VSFPAYEHLGKNIGRGFARWRVYMHLVHQPVLNFVTPVEVKVTALAVTLEMSPRKTIEALDWLVGQGYIVQHARHGRRVRSLTLAWELLPKQAA
jgi:hypothetical protein